MPLETYVVLRHSLTTGRTHGFEVTVVNLFALIQVSGQTLYNINIKQSKMKLQPSNSIPRHHVSAAGLSYLSMPSSAALI